MWVFQRIIIVIVQFFYVSDCTWDPNRVPKNFHSDSCSSKLTQVAVGKSIGIVVLNCFLIIVSLISIPILWQTQHPSDSYVQNEFFHESFPHSGQDPVSFDRYAANINSPGRSFTNFNASYTSWSRMMIAHCYFYSPLFF